MARSTAAAAVALLLLALSLSSFSVAFEQRIQQPLSNEEEEQYVYSFKDVKPIVEEEAGKFWHICGKERNSLLQKMGYSIFAMELEPCATTMPYYDEGSYACFVEEGNLMWKSALIGKPLDTTKVKAKDAVIVPTGHADALYNPTKDKGKIVCIARFVPKEGAYIPEPPRWKLVGDPTDKMEASVFKSFGEDVLSSAYDISREDAKELTKDVDARIFKFDKECKSSQQMLRGVANFGLNYGSNPFVCEIGSMKPTEQNDYGELRVCNAKTHPPSTKADLTVDHMMIKKGSMRLPHFHPTMVSIGIVWKGKLKLTLVGPKGPIVRNKELNEGDVFIVPPGHPHVVITPCDQEAEVIGFRGCAEDKTVFLSGPDNLLEALSFKSGAYLAAVFGVDKDKAQRLFTSQKQRGFSYDPKCKKESPDPYGIYEADVEYEDVHDEWADAGWHETMA